MDATESGMLDWEALRERLAKYRRDKPFKVAELAAAIHVAPTTIYRIENVKKQPAHRPDLPTMIEWLDATGGPTISSFLAQFEVLPAGAKPQDDQSTPALKAVDVDQAPTPADIKIAQLEQKIEDLKQSQERFIKRIAKATIADFTRQTEAFEDGRRSVAGHDHGGPARRSRHKTAHPRNVRADAATKKTVGGKS